MSADEAQSLAVTVWHGINLPNLHEHIVRARGRGLIVRKDVGEAIEAIDESHAAPRWRERAALGRASGRVHRRLRRRVHLGKEGLPQADARRLHAADGACHLAIEPTHHQVAGFSLDGRLPHRSERGTAGRAIDEGKCRTGAGREVLHFRAWGCGASRQL